MIYSKYLVKETDLFDPVFFPRIADDLDTLAEAMAKSPGLRHPEMLIMFARDNHLEADWVRANPALAEQISSKSLPVANLEALFAAARKNAAFCRSLEEYIGNRFRTSAVPSVY